MYRAHASRRGCAGCFGFSSTATHSPHQAGGMGGYVAVSTPSRNSPRSIKGGCIGVGTPLMRARRVNSSESSCAAEGSCSPGSRVILRPHVSSRIEFSYWTPCTSFNKVCSPETRVRVRLCFCRNCIFGSRKSASGVTKKMLRYRTCQG